MQEGGAKTGTVLTLRPLVLQTMSRKKLRRDREAGLHFNWHLPEGSSGRILLALAVAILFWGALLVYVQIRVPEPSALPNRASDLEIIDLESIGNLRLSNFIERESPFSNRWEVGDSTALEKQVESALAQVSRQPYQVILEQTDHLSKASMLIPLQGLPGHELGALPPPEPVEIQPIQRVPAEWWLSVDKTEGAEDWKGMTFRWEGEEQGLSVGESWTFQIGLDWRGRLISSLPLKGRKETPSKAVHDALRATTFPQVKEGSPIRWWMLEARTEDRSKKSTLNLKLPTQLSE